MGNIFWWQVKAKTKMGSYNREKVDERKIVSVLQNDEWNQQKQLHLTLDNVEGMFVNGSMSPLHVSSLLSFPMQGSAMPLA
jgi:hypothetical protein